MSGRRGTTKGREGIVERCLASALRQAFGTTGSEARSTVRGVEEPEGPKYDPEPQKKIQPPVSAGYEGLLFPPEQSEKIFVAIVP